MSYDAIAAKIAAENRDVEISTMMKSPCLRYRGDFMAMDSEKMNALIVKLSPERVNALIAGGEGQEFNFTKKKFREWVLIPREREGAYEGYIREALEYARQRTKGGIE
jgi:hypothetical protein